MIEKRRDYSLIYAPERALRSAGSKRYQNKFSFNVKPPSDPDPIFSSRISRVEILRTFPEGYKLAINLFPPVSQACLLIASSLKPQIIDAEFLLFLLRFTMANRRLVVFYNSWGAAASKNAQHAQVLPLEILEFANTSMLKARSIQFKIGKEDSFDAKRLTKTIFDFQEGIGRYKNGIPFNLLFCQNTVYLIPRRAMVTQIEGRYFRKGVFSPCQKVEIGMPGFFELMRVFVVTDQHVRQGFCGKTANEISRRCFYSERTVCQISGSSPPTHQKAVPPRS